MLINFGKYWEYWIGIILLYPHCKIVIQALLLIQVWTKLMLWTPSFIVALTTISQPQNCRAYSSWNYLLRTACPIELLSTEDSVFRLLSTLDTTKSSRSDGIIISKNVKKNCMQFRDVWVQRRLLAEAYLTFTKAFELAKAAKLAERHLKILQKQSSQSATGVNFFHETTERLCRTATMFTLWRKAQPSVLSIQGRQMACLWQSAQEKAFQDWKLSHCSHLRMFCFTLIQTKS